MKPPRLNNIRITKFRSTSSRHITRGSSKDHAQRHHRKISHGVGERNTDATAQRIEDAAAEIELPALKQNSGEETIYNDLEDAIWKNSEALHSTIL
ncbi:hypothetical protein Bca101_000205 [Brassica carinata]